jgi:hypothetical protein
MLSQSWEASLVRLQRGKGLEDLPLEDQSLEEGRVCLHSRNYYTQQAKIGISVLSYLINKQESPHFEGFLREYLREVELMAIDINIPFLFFNIANI